ncbi:cytochrome-c oxidase, cbb3-type subunit III [Pannonibacter sp. Q-1]|uniref:Cbb3-type cytochrome c oxidase subunit n=1 Tax=Pannonibacter phragmitetus TaxID=121719 RepID=A0A0U3MYQ1_9HYPH|nr:MULTISPECIES: cytochrome-c oxidase, cbb3-type subunit III [Pannonibacter]ALV25688.1 cytochrome C oxidase Cbb3 [Pannonibacter phragmitetus]MBA4207485.1 cytochrome-c oxidase, cbb3-type subunit III [Polymorphum sp.]
MSDNHKKEIDAVSGVETTGHEWDGLKELNNPLPKWWLYVFYATIVWAIGYWVVYPSWPLLSGYTAGVLGNSQRADALAAVEAGQAARAQLGAGLNDASLEEIAAKPELLDFAMANGRAAFGDNCAPCHGSGGTGAVGYPNLQDDVWIWGGTLDDIHTTLQYGIRSGHDEARFAEMPAFGRDGLLDKTEVDQVSSFVAARAGLEPEAGVDLAAGEVVYQDNCASCHGEDLAGIREMGAPNLLSANYVFGKSVQAIKAQVNAPRHGVMPAWEGRLDPATIKSLAVYVHSFGGGE